MRTLLTTLLALLAVLPAQAETTNICDRTPEVRDAILKELDAGDCAAVDLAGVAELGVLLKKVERDDVLRAKQATVAAPPAELKKPVDRALGNAFQHSADAHKIPELDTCRAADLEASVERE